MPDGAATPTSAVFGPYGYRQTLALLATLSPSELTRKNGVCSSRLRQRRRPPVLAQRAQGGHFFVWYIVAINAVTTTGRLTGGYQQVVLAATMGRQVRARIQAGDIVAEDR